MDHMRTCVEGDLASIKASNGFRQGCVILFLML